jgi:hypothetical protein
MVVLSCDLIMMEDGHVAHKVRHGSTAGIKNISVLAA